MSRTITEFDKYPDEILDQAVEFSAELGGDTIASATAIAHDRGGVLRTSDVLGSAVAVGTTVEYTVSGGVAGEVYTLTIKAVLTTTSQELEHRLRMTVVPPG